MPDLILVAVPLAVLVLVAVFGFVGCTNEYGRLRIGGGGGGNGPDGGPPTYAEAVLNSGPIAYWRLSDPEGSPFAKDEVGAPAQQFGDHPGSYQSTVTHGGSPPGLNASEPDATFALFDGGDDFIGIGTVVDFQTTEFTVEALVRPDSVAGPTDAIIRNMSLAGGWALNLVPPPEGADPATGGQLQAFVRAASVSSIEAPFDLAQLGTVLHVAMALDGTKGLTLYLDGAAVNADSAPSFAPNIQDPLQIGTNFHGAIQEVAVYDKALDAEAIGIHHMANASPPPGP